MSAETVSKTGRGTEKKVVTKRHGILDYSGRDNRRLAEVKSVHEKFQKLSEIAGSKYEAKVGFLKDYDNAWDSQLDVWHEKPSADFPCKDFCLIIASHTFLFSVNGNRKDHLWMYLSDKIRSV